MTHRSKVEAKVGAKDGADPDSIGIPSSEVVGTLRCAVVSVLK